MPDEPLPVAERSMMCGACNGFGGDCPECDDEGVVCSQCERVECLWESPEKCVGDDIHAREERGRLELAFLQESRRWRKLKVRCEEARYFVEQGRREALEESRCEICGSRDDTGPWEGIQGVRENVCDDCWADLEMEE